MPRVPFLDAPQVQQGAAHPEYQNVHAPTPGPAEFGAAVGEGLQQLGAGMGHAASIIEQEQQKADHAAAAGVATAFKDRANQVVSAYHSEEGENAIHAAEATNQALQKASEEVLSKAQVSARARNIARQDIQSDLVTARSAVRGHLAQQTDVAQDAAYKGQMASSLTAVANSFADPLVREQEIATGAKRVEDQARVRGLGEDATKASVAKWRQDAAGVVMNALIGSENGPGARAYFEANHDALGAQAAAFAPHVRALGIKDESRSETARIQAEAPDDLEKQLALAKEIKDTGVFDATDQRLKQDFSVREELKQKADHQRLGRVFSGILDSHGYLDRQSRDFVDLSDKGKADAIQKAQSDSEYWARKKKGLEGETLDQRMAYAKLIMDVADNPESYQRMSSEEFGAKWFPQLSPKQSDDAARLLAHVHAPANDQTKVQAFLAGQGKAIMDAGQSAGVFGKKNDIGTWTEDQKQLFSDAQGEYQKRLTLWQADPKNKNQFPPHELSDKWTSDIFAKVHVEGGKFLGLSIPFTSSVKTRLQADRDGKPYEDIIPEREKAQITEALKSSGTPVTDENIRDRYLRLRGKPRPVVPVSAPAPAPEAPSGPGMGERAREVGAAISKGASTLVHGAGAVVDKVAGLTDLVNGNDHTGKVELVGPKGESDWAPPGPELDTWLKANPKWRRK